MSGMERLIRVEVDGEVFDVRRATGSSRPVRLRRTSGPNSGFGFFSASSYGRPSTMADHEEAIRNFLSQVDPRRATSSRTLTSRG
jgi:hypothetical protein